MKRLFALVYLGGFLSVNASSMWRPDDRLLDALCHIESSGGRFVSGDGGLSLGYFQIQKPAWTDVNNWRKQQNLNTYNYRTDVFDPRISRLYAADYLTILHTRLSMHYNREPTAGELYAAYNMGLNGFRKCGYDVSNANPVTRSKCSAITVLAGRSAMSQSSNSRR